MAAYNVSERKNGIVQDFIQFGADIPREGAIEILCSRVSLRRKREDNGYGNDRIKLHQQIGAQISSAPGFGKVPIEHTGHTEYYERNKQPDAHAAAQTLRYDDGEQRHKRHGNRQTVPN